jgi:PAS domain S-box-containing protein
LNKEEARFIDQMSGFVSVALFNSRVYQAMAGLKDRLEEKTLTLSNEIAVRRQAEEKVSESWARYKLLADNVIDIIWVLDINTLKFRYISPSVERIIGYSVHEMIGKGLDFFLTPASYEYVLKTQDNLLASGWINKGETLSMELEHVCKDGKCIWVEVSAHMLDNSRWPDSLIGVSRDITDRKRSEKEKKILEARLMQAQKMESIGVLAGGIAHDFNNILMSILGYTQLTRLYVPDENKTAHEKLSRIEKASFRAKDMVSQILAFSRQSEPSILPVQMGPIIIEAIKLLKGSLPSTLTIVKDFQDNIRPVLADPVQIHQVVINLCSNAAHAMEDQGGVIRVGLLETRLEARDALSMNLPPGYYVQLTVSDTGSGMDGKIMEKIFDPYFTTKEVGKGSGMGLAVVHGIVVSCGGKITVESALGRGSTFKLLFPASESMVKEEKDPADRLLYGNERILFVDDEKDIVELAREALGAMGYRVTGAVNGIEALHIFTENPDGFDMVITDLTMPTMTGERLAGEIHSLRPRVPVILCTGYNTYFPDEKARESGIRDILIKPVPARDMAEVIRDILDSGKDSKPEL